MELLAAISREIPFLGGIIALATAIKEQKDLSEELEEAVEGVLGTLQFVENVMDQLKELAPRLAPGDEHSLLGRINLVTPIYTNINRVLEKVQRKRGCIQTLFMKRKKYRRRLNQYKEDLNTKCGQIQTTIPSLTLIDIDPHNISDFRSQFGSPPEKEVSSFDFSIDKSTSNTTLTVAIEHFDPKKHSCYMKLQRTLDEAQFFISYQLRTWSAPKPRSIILAKRRELFTKEWKKRNTPDFIENDSNQNPSTSTRTVPPTTDVASNINREKLDFSEFLSSLGTICGMALTQSRIYIATEYQITIYSLNNREVLATFGTEGDGPNSLKHISDIYIPSNNETNLYVVDRGRNVVHCYRIIDSNPYLEYEHQYVVIGNQHQSYRLQSCVIYRTNLYVTDSGNRCIHVFPLEGERQSIYISDKSVTPFSPGPICAHEGYLYVADCSLENPSVLVLNEECKPVDWFCSSSIRQILAIDIERNMNELFILTTTRTEDETNEPRNRPLIVSMDLIIRTRTQQ